MAILTVGIDLAKNVFAVHGVNQAGKPELVKPVVARTKRMAKNPAGARAKSTCIGSIVSMLQTDAKRCLTRLSLSVLRCQFAGWKIKTAW